MSRLLALVRGFSGHPLHPPLTDVSIGAYTAGVLMLVLGALGLEEQEMAHGSLLAISLGLLLAPPTVLTGILDWLDLPKGTPRRTTATVHLFVMAGATALFVLTWLAQLAGYQDGSVGTLAWVLGLAAMGMLTAGGWIGGALAFVHGVRVLKRSDAPVGDALIPGRAEASAPEEGPDASRRGP
jgi:uncharacterized membrane protein